MNIKKYLHLSVLTLCCWILSACTNSPDKYFDVAVFNSRMVSGFGNSSFEMDLQLPPEMLATDSTTQTVPMKRSEVVDEKIDAVEYTLEKIKGLKKTDDAKNILETSIALAEFALPVYKNEYRQLAGLYDQGASAQEIQFMTQAIHDKYHSRFLILSTAFIIAAKTYATKHNIKVREQT